MNKGQRVAQVYPDLRWRPGAALNFQRPGVEGRHRRINLNGGADHMHGKGKSGHRRLLTLRLQ